PGRRGRLRLSVRHKLTLFSTLVILAVSSGFTWVSLGLARRAIEEDLRNRAIVYAREVAAAIGRGRELESGPEIHHLIVRLLEIRTSVLQLDVLAYDADGLTLVASNEPRSQLSFTWSDAEDVQRGRVISRAVSRGGEHHWEVMAPITLEGAVAGAVAVKFSAQRSDQLIGRIQFWALTLAGASLVLMGVLMTVAIQYVVDRPIRRFMDAISAAADDGAPAPVTVTTTDEFGVLARHFNEMVARIERFSEELRTRIAEATGELDHRVRQVEQLNVLLYEMQRRLSHAERLALSGRVMAEVAHEVGTPLHSVAGHLELLRRDLSPGLLSEDVTRRLGIIETQVARVIEIISRLLDATRRVPGEPTAVDLNALVRDTAELVRPGLAGARLTLEVRTEPGLPTVLGQRDQLQQVILNFLTNAIDASPLDGSVTMTTRSRAGQEEVEIAIADTGHGISAADRKHIFEPFFSTKEAGRGTGLGLFITAEIVREHKGRIEVDSEEGKGATFRVCLPALGTEA
ncbi:MAG TPA: ATP-binding protein, partial [Methylomirabilota bacterium]|nr:ATP-binding protein [Methylomirabilota bacterium]